MIKQGQQAQQNKQPSPEDQKNISAAQLNQAKTQESLAKTQEVHAKIQGLDASSQLDFMAVAQGNPKVY